MPNGDGTNDGFYIIGMGIDKIQLTIREGINTVFKSNAVIPYWDGKINEIDAPEGKYDIYLNVTTTDSSTYDIKATVCLMRCVPKGFDISNCQFGSQFSNNVKYQAFDPTRSNWIVYCD